jgi:Parkin co-regulated protein
MFATPHIFDGTDNSGTMFRTAYESGRLPCKIKHGAVAKLDWSRTLEKSDILTLLPMFVEGMLEKTNPYRYVATQGTSQLLSMADSNTLLAALPQIIPGLKKLLETHCPHNIVNSLKIIQTLTKSHESIAHALVPYYRVLLYQCALFRAKKRCTIDRVDYAELHRDGRLVGEIVEETLDLLEATGGPDAFANIKYMINTWESCSSK